jgi:hypothetical protein
METRFSVVRAGLSAMAQILFTLRAYLTMTDWKKQDRIDYGLVRLASLGLVASGNVKAGDGWLV